MKKEKIVPVQEPYYGTARGLDVELNLPRESWMQDWPIEVIKAAHLPMLVEHYEKANEIDKKYVLMTAMLEAIIMTPKIKATDVLVYLEKINQFLIADYLIHEYHIYHWLKYRSKNYEELPSTNHLGKLNADIKNIYESNNNRNPKEKRRIEKEERLKEKKD